MRIDELRECAKDNYEILDTEGSNFWLIDDDGNEVSFGMCRFVLP